MNNLSLPQGKNGFCFANWAWDHFSTVPQLLSDEMWEQMKELSGFDDVTVSVFLDYLEAQGLITLSVDAHGDTLISLNSSREKQL